MVRARRRAAGRPVVHVSSSGVGRGRDSVMGNSTAARATAMMHVSVARSPSMSVAVNVYVVAGCSAVGVPAIRPSVVVSLGAMYVRPGGNAGVNA